MKLSPIRPVRLYEQIVARFKQMADVGELKPGDWLPSERLLVEQLGVSRAVLLEALRVMEVQGMLETLPGEGRVFARSGLAQLGQVTNRVLESAVLEVLDAREALECKIVELATERATLDDIMQLKALINLAEDDHNTQGYTYEWNSRFHLAIAAAARNAVLYELLNLLLQLRADLHRKDLLSQDELKEIATGHLQIVEAIENRDVSSARDLIRRHITQTKEAVTRLDEGLTRETVNNLEQV